MDGCVLPVSTGPEHGKGLLDAVGQITTRHPGIHASAGVSNVSFGLPLRKLLNETFAVLLMARGLDAGIVDPCDAQLMANIRAAEALLGRDGIAPITCAPSAKGNWNCRRRRKICDCRLMIVD